MRRASGSPVDHGAGRGIDRAVDPAVARARGVVGLYGDPTVSWSIGLDVTLSKPVDPPTLAKRCQHLVDEHGHLGRRPAPQSFDDQAASGVLAALLDLPYGDQDPLVRIALSGPGDRLLLAAHHGALDGLGLLAALAILLREPVASTASGIGDATSAVGFVRSSASRLAEAVFRPPERVARLSAPGDDEGRTAGPGDVTARLDLAVARVNTARVVSAAAQAVREWNTRHGRPARRIVAAIGASRRDGSGARPNRDTAYLRVRLPPDLSEASAREAIAATLPEPSFPERPVGGWAALVTRALRSRLGSSLLVSNLGLIQSGSSVERIAFYPSAAGPRALAVGVASTSSYTTVTVRMPRADFSQQAADQLCASIAHHLAGASGSQ